MIWLKNGGHIRRRRPIGTATYSSIMESLNLTPREIASIERVLGHKLKPWKRSNETPPQRARAKKKP